MKAVVTGCFGFIGSYFCKYLLTNYPDTSIVGVARGPNPRNEMRLENFINNPKLRIIYKDLAIDPLYDVIYDADYVFHFAARTHVDFSIQDPKSFERDNVQATVNLLEAERKCNNLKRHFQISTDEVYGQILEGAYKEDASPNPRNPYAASKLAADGFVLGYHNTYGLPVTVTRTENNYGNFQDPSKAIPTFVKKALKNEPLPVYGDGKHRRMWLHVRDHCRSLTHLIDHGKVGEIYHVAGEQELENIELARRILRILKKPEDMIRLVPDHNIRPGHDRRYALNVEKLKATGWSPSTTLDEGLMETVSWYAHNEWWLE